ncbi:AAA family ATPase [Deinococcus lacus]|uniref:AAA family ATPase n=1 Tax=Deinococcus lacus TaxID=392561 RepID=A0ABW1YAI9_9DEIO
MKPLHLSLQGFTAFRQHTELDFSDLELFAVVGPTGSGKSSLLDAMTFALYGQTPRLGSTGLEALISQGERALSVSLTFEVGGTTYRVARSKGRRTADTGVKFEQYDAGRWVDRSQGLPSKAVTAQIQETVGLDAKNFTRAIVLPQGDFAKVLLGSSKDRQELLGELIGLGTVRDMQKYAAERHKELRFELSSLQALLSGEYAGVSAEQVAALRAEREAAAQRQEALTGQREEKAAELTRWQAIERVWQAREDVQRRLSAQRSRSAGVEAGAQRAAQARRVAAIIPLLDAASRARIAAERDQAAAAAAEAQAQTAAAAATQAQDSAAAAELAAQTVPDLEARAEALRDAGALATRLKRAGGTPESRHDQPLAWDEDAYSLAHEQAAALDRLRLERTQIDAQQASLEAERARQEKERGEYADRSAELERLKREGLEAKTQADQAHAELERVQTQAGLESYHAALHVGEPCPLCGQTVKTLPPPPTEASATVARLQAEVRALDNALVERRGRYAEVQERVKALKAALAEREQTLTDWAAQLEQRGRDAREQERSIAGDPHDDAARLLAGLAAQVRAFGPDPSGERTRLQARVKDLRAAVTRQAAAAAQAASAAAAAQATWEASHAAAQARSAEAQEAAERLSAALAAAGLEAAQAQSAALPEAEIAALEQAAQQHTATLSALEQQLGDLRAQASEALAGREYDPQALPRLSQELTGLDAELSAAQETAGRLAEQERSASARLERRLDIETQAADLAHRSDTWQTLSGNLSVREFQQYLLAEVESGLLSGAGHILFGISDGRYRLVLADKDYAVQDLWNAGETRAVKTLSGGETFLASLSLAIALSEYLAGNRTLGALFLDEGFGTLDPQALEAVASALENLRTQGRMVGVVTHVESLSERLPTRLLVTKSMAGSSVQRFDN